MSKQPEQVKKRVHPLAVVLPIAAVMLIAAASLLLVFAGGEKYILAENTIWCYYDAQDNITEVYINDHAAKIELAGRVRQFQTDYAGTSAVILSETGELYSVTPEGFSMVSDSIAVYLPETYDSYVYSYQLSLDGRTIVYVNADYELYTYSVADRKAMLIADNVRFSQMSPNGKAIAYLITVGEKHYETYLWHRGTSILLGENFLPAALPDSGDYLYAFSSAMQLYRISASGETDRITGDPVSRIIVNLSCSEMIYVTKEETQMVLIGEDIPDRIRLGSYGEGYGLVASSQYNLSTENLYSVLNQVDCIPVETFARQLYLFQEENGDRSLVYLNEAYETLKLVGNVDDWMISDSGETVYYSQAASLYRLELSDIQNPMKLASGIQDFAAAYDGEKVFFINEDSELLMLDKNARSQEGVMIAENISHIIMSPQNSLYYLVNYDEDLCSGTLYACEDEKNIRKVAEEVHSVSTFGTMTAVWSEYDADRGVYDFHISADGVVFSPLKSDISNRTVIGYCINSYTYSGKYVPF